MGRKSNYSENYKREAVAKAKTSGNVSRHDGLPGSPRPAAARGSLSQLTAGQLQIDCQYCGIVIRIQGLILRRKAVNVEQAENGHQMRACFALTVLYSGIGLGTSSVRAQPEPTACRALDAIIESIDITSDLILTKQGTATHSGITEAGAANLIRR